MDESTARKSTVTACPVCGARRFGYLFSIESLRLVQCNECNFSLLNPQPGNPELSAVFSQSPFAAAPTDPAAKAADELKARTAAGYLDLLNRYSGLSSGKLLEIGSGNGQLLAAAAARGFTVTGVEQSEPACENSRRRLASAGLTGEVIAGEFGAIADRAGEFNAVILANVIEHVREPRHFVQVLHRVLRPGGVILIATPSLDSWSARFKANRWLEFKPERLSYFSRKTLEALLFSEGFRGLAHEPGHKSRDIGIPASAMIVLGQRHEKPARPRLSIVVPVFNEAATFRDSFSRLLAHPMPQVDVEYLVVESNSTDGTRAIVQEFAQSPGVRLLFEDRPRGKGHAVRTGLKAAQGDFVVIQDADLEYDLEDYDALLEPLLSNRAAFVLGARHGGRAWKMRQFTGQPITSLLLNFGHWFFTMLLNVCFFVNLRDPFTMYKVFRRDCIHGLEFESNRFDFDWEIVIKLIRRGYVPIELPVNYRSRSFKEGKKVSVIRDPLTWFWAVLRFRFAKVPRWSPVSAATALGNPAKKA